MPIAAPVLAGLISAGTSGINAVSQGLQNRANRKFTEKMYDRQRMDNLADWTSQKDYDLPANQMARLKAAGLNPNLVYGGGSVTQSGGSPAHTPAGSPDTKAPQLDSSDLTRSILSMIDVDRLEAQKDLMQKQIELMEYQKSQSASQTEAIQQGTAGAKFELGQKMRLADTNFEQMQQNVEKTKADTQYTLDQNERAAALNAETVRKAAIEILAIRRGMAKTSAEINHINQQIENLKTAKASQELDMKIKNMSTKSALDAALDALRNSRGNVNRVKKEAADVKKGWEDQRFKWKAGQFGRRNY